jgi:hypothetical protein
MRSRFGIALCFLLFGVASYSYPYAPDSATPPPAKTDSTSTGEKQAATTAITVVGRLTNEGIECRTLRQDKSNNLFTLTGNVPYKNGTHVKVIGTITQVSFCQQGTTIALTSITKVK